MKATDLLIPVRRYAPATGRFTLPRELSISGEPEGSIVVEQLRGELAPHKVRVAASHSRDAQLRLVRTGRGAAEAYRLDITRQMITVTAAGDAGIYYGAQTLREMIRLAGTGAKGGLALPACRIDDAPDFARRGIYLDCSRGRVPTVERLKQLIELFAHWKVNELQLYIENVFQFRTHPAIGRGYSPFTAEDILELQAHCRRHHMKFVGSLASLGHMEKVLQLPQYRKLGEMPGFQSWPGGTTLCVTDPNSFKLLEDLYGEFVPLFEADDFNICGDEPWELGRGRSILRARWGGVGRLYLDFLKKMQRLCERLGKRTNVWGDIVLKHPELLDEMPRDLVLLNWDYDPPFSISRRTHEITDLGLAAVACPGTHGWFSHGSRVQMAMDNIAQFAAEGLRCGTEGFLNTDWGNNGHRNLIAVSLHALAWGAAHGWCHKRTEQRGFTERFCRQTFAADKNMADAIVKLGTPMHDQHWDAHILYNGLIPSVQASYDHMEMALEALDCVRYDALTKHQGTMASLKWPRAGKRMPPVTSSSSFIGEMLEEFRIMAGLEALACCRCHALKSVQEGKAVSAAEWRGLINATQGAAAEFARVWRLGNRPSRLDETLSAFKQTVSAYAKASRGKPGPELFREHPGLSRLC